MESQTKKTLEQVVDATIQRALTIEITILPKNRLHAWLQRKRILPVKKTYEIRPIVLGNLLRISSLLLSIDPKFLKGGNGLLDTGHQLASYHTDTLIQVLAIAIQNNRAEPSGSLMSLIKYNLSPREMHQLLGIVLEQMDLTNFITSIISIRGLNVLETSETLKEVSPEI